MTWTDILQLDSSPKVVSVIKPLIKEHYDKQDRPLGPSLRASNSGKCQRALAYQYHGYESLPVNFRGRMVFEMGNMVETQLVDVMKNYGLKDMQKECMIEIEGVQIKGHIDGIFGDYVVDFKSCTQQKLRELARTADVGDYLYTMHFYMQALNMSKALLVYYCKDTSALLEIELNFDHTIWHFVESKFKRVIKSNKNDLLQRDYGPNVKGFLPWQCSYCSFVNHCFPQYELNFTPDGKPQLKIKEK